MSTKRTPIARVGRYRVTAEMRPKLERVFRLHLDMSAANRIGADQAFFRDGRHEEFLALGIEVYGVLGIRPWDDAVAILHDVLTAAD